LVGDIGNDLFIVDNTADAILENSAEGTDSVQSSVTYTLAANIENLTLTGAAAIDGTGNALDNVIVGNSAANHLYGAAGNDSLDGGTGADTLDGGSGNDTYTIDNVGDVITESAGGGTDTAQSSVSYTLSAEVENLTLTGASAINGTGNTLANVIVGNGGANILDGGVDAVSDSLSGGAGNDTINIRTADTADAGTGDDVLVLFDNTGFGTITGGTNTSNTMTTAGNLGDVLAFNGTLDLTPAAQIAKVSNIETISMADSIGGAGADALTLNVNDVINLGTGTVNPTFSGGDNYSSKDAIKVNGEAGDTLHLTQTTSGGADHWHQVATATNIPAGYALWVHETTASNTGAAEDAYVLVQTTIAVTTP
jgi:Ca2+-binding RTX toxin-like protein